MAKKIRRGRRKLGQGRPSRDLIVDAYVDLMHRAGPFAITLESLAKECGLTLGSVRYYFSEWGVDLNHAAIEEVLNRSYQWIEDEMYDRRRRKGFDPIQSYIEVMFDWILAKRKDSSFLVYFYFLCTTDVQLPIKNDEVLERARLRIRALLHEGIGQGLYGVKSVTDELVLKIHSSVMGACMYAGTMSSPQANRTIRKMCQDLVMVDILRTSSGSRTAGRG